MSGWPVDRQRWCCEKKNVACLGPVGLPPFRLMESEIIEDQAVSNAAFSVVANAATASDAAHVAADEAIAIARRYESEVDKTPAEQAAAVAAQRAATAASAALAATAAADAAAKIAAQQAVRAGEDTARDTVVFRSPIFNCNDDIGHADAWSDNKKTWCCRHSGRGCPLNHNLTRAIIYNNATYVLPNVSVPVLANVTAVVPVR